VLQSRVYHLLPGLVTLASIWTLAPIMESTGLHVAMGALPRSLRWRGASADGHSLLPRLETEWAPLLGGCSLVHEAHPGGSDIPCRRCHVSLVGHRLLIPPRLAGRALATRNRIVAFDLLTDDRRLLHAFAWHRSGNLGGWLRRNRPGRATRGGTLLMRVSSALDAGLSDLGTSGPCHPVLALSLLDPLAESHPHRHGSAHRRCGAEKAVGLDLMVDTFTGQHGQHDGLAPDHPEVK